MKTIENEGIVWLHIDSLFPHPDNPRKEIGDVSELAASIKAKGIMQNLTVVPRKKNGENNQPSSTASGPPSPDLRGKDNLGAHGGSLKLAPLEPTDVSTERTRKNCDSDKHNVREYTVIIGHRRLTAAREAGLRTLPCVIVEMSEQEQIETMLLENMQRVDLTPFEQAQGFQMMIDFGDSIEEISGKTGFSETTIRRRIKMNELDAGKLREVSERQISIADLDRLSKIDDLTVRNRVLESIGTNNFESEYQQALKKQEIARMVPKAKELVKKLKAKKINRSDTYGGKYDRIGDKIDLHKWDGSTIPVKDGEERKIYYHLDENWGDFAFYVERPKAKPVKRPKAELEKEKRIAEAWAQYDQATALAHTLRSTFIASLTVTKSNMEAVLRGAAVACAYNVIGYPQTNSTDIYKMLGLEERQYENGIRGVILETVRSGDLSLFPKIIYAAFGDKESIGYSGGYRREFPVHSKNTMLDALYAWLCSLGYEMSDEEKALQDGTHEVFSHKGS